jgi:N-acetylglutamate synthase-like GNAT family acetyltransferase
MRLLLLLAGCCLHAVTARRPPPAGAVAQKHISEGALNAYAIGEGFEGSASDWTEYVVWSVGVAALIFYLSGVVKINVYNIDEEPIKREPEHIEVRVLESLDDAAQVSDLKDVIATTVRESNEKNELSRQYAKEELEIILGRFCDLEAHLATRLIYIASIDDDVAGCGMLTRATGEVRQMVCLPAYQGRGVGSAILREILAAARSSSLERLYLECPPIKRDWYARVGFVECARRPSDTAAEFPGVNARAPMELVL